MSAKRDDGATFLRVVVAHGLEHAEALVTAIGELGRATGDRPDRVTHSGTTRAYKEDTLRSAAAAPEVLHLSWWSERPAPGVEGHVYLRDDPAASEFTDRWCGVVVPGRRHVEPLLAFVRQLDLCFGVVGGGLGWFPTRAYAAKEIHRGGVPGEWDAATVARLEWDTMKWRRSRSRLLRLLPVTIIGPEIWGSLPPMPTSAPMPAIDDLGDGKVLTCWPELVEPHDPAFVAGTKELRRWIWPYTIQNPADEPNALERRVGA